jgi:hypothetical protein
MELTAQQMQEVAIIRSYLINVIRTSGKCYYTTYQKMVDDCKLPYPDLNKHPLYRKQLGLLLAFILKEDNQKGFPILTSIIYGAKLYRPRNGFYITLCRENPVKTEFRTPIQVSMDKKFRRTFEYEAVDFWKNDNNYNLFFNQQ